MGIRWTFVDTFLHICFYFRLKKGENIVILSGKEKRVIKVNENYILGGMGEASGCAFTLIQAGHLSPRSGHICCFGNYNCWHVVTSGNGYLKCREKVYPLKVGDVFSVMYDCSIEYGASAGKGWSFIFLRIEGEKAREMTRRMGLSPERPVLTGGGEKCVELFKKIMFLARENCRNAEEYAIGILRIMTFFTSSLPERHRTKEELVADAVKLMEHTMENEWNINDLARNLHICRTILFHAFRSVTGESPVNFLHKIRLKKCKELIEKNPCSTFQEIAEMLRFSDEKYFMRFFRRKSGMTPGEYRKSLFSSGRKEPSGK